MLDKIEKYIEKYNMISERMKIIAGISGGADSVCMLLNLIEYQKKVSFDIEVIHINHMIRKEAMDDANFVKNLCDKYSLPFYLYSEDVEGYAKQNGISTEEAGRIIRYSRFNEHCSENSKIAVAHNRNDVAETVLFNIFRGTGIEGLASLTPVNGNIIRPLLGVSRSEIEGYLKEVNQEYKTDSTNATNDYARNKIRNTILPFIESEIVENATEHIAAMSEKMILVRDYIKEDVRLKYAEIVHDTKEMACIKLDEFNKLEELMKRELILAVLEAHTPGRKDIGEVHVTSIIELTSKDGEKKVSLPYGLEAIKKYEELIIREKINNAKVFFEKRIEVGNEVLLDDGKCLKTRVFDNAANADIPRNTYTKWFDYDKIINCLVVRNRNSGDYLTVNSKYDKKSLKDYMIDTKIEKEKRDDILVVADGSHIVWVVGYRISEYYKVTMDTKRVIEVSIE